MTVKVAFSLSVLNVGVDNQTLSWGSFSLTKDFNFNKLSWISLGVELGATFVPIYMIILVGFFRTIGMIWWLKSSTVEPEKRLTLTRRPFPYNFSFTIPFRTESATMTAVPIRQWSLLTIYWFIFVTSITANTLFMFVIFLLLFHFKLILLFLD